MNQLRMLRMLLEACEELEDGQPGEALGSIVCIAAMALAEEHGRVAGMTAANVAKLALAKLLVEDSDDNTSPSIPQPSLN